MWRGNSEFDGLSNMNTLCLFVSFSSKACHSSSSSMDNPETADVPIGPTDDVPGPNVSPPADITADTIAFPDPIASPAEFLQHLRSLPIADLVTAWQHYLSRPIRAASTNQHVEGMVDTWLDRMDTLTVSLVTTLHIDCLLIISVIGPY